jgi:hypothetical protein
MKARDVIPGWPRGRSSSRPIRIPAWFRFAWYKARMENRSHPIFGPSDEAFEEFTRTNIILFFEAEVDAKYRAEQDRMTKEYRIEQYKRLLDEARIFRQNSALLEYHLPLMEQGEVVSKDAELPWITRRNLSQEEQEEQHKAKRNRA